jgi:hypothetical protein
MMAKAPIIRSKKYIKCCQEKFEKYYGILVSILDTETNSA